MTNLNSHRANNILIAIVLVLFSSLVAPKLPRSVTKYLENPIVKISLFLVIAYLATNDLPSAIIAIIAVLVSYQTLSVHKITDTVIKKTKDIINNTTNNQIPNNQIPNNQDINNAYNVNNNQQEYNNHPNVSNNPEFEKKLMVIPKPELISSAPPDVITNNKKQMIKSLKGDINQVEYNIPDAINFDLVNGDVNTLTNTMAQELKPIFKCYENPNIIDSNGFDNSFVSYLPL